MASQLIINVTKPEIRVALMENDRVAELYIERPNSRGLVGNIYKGKVVRVLPGMQASFVDIGLERAAFLYVTDFFEEYRDAFSQKEVEEERRHKRGQPQRQKIQDLLKEGQEVLVQVAKDPIGTKGARLTSHISLPGRHLVYMPTVNHIGVSRKIESEKERRRLRQFVGQCASGNGGFIVRTAAGGQSDEKLQADIQYLERLWQKTLGRHQGMKAPAMLHQDLGLVQRAVRDFFIDDVEMMVVDDRTAYRSIKQFIGQFLPKGNYNVEFYRGRIPIFEYYKIDPQIEKALAKKVWLKSGGYLVVDQTEALTSIDVNTGRFVGSKNLEETILKTNLEAVKEIVAQLRLRNIGGLIILDFIDMDRKQNRAKVYRAFEDALADDKAKTNVLQISELGLVEMTRKRTRENLSRLLCETCANCEGKGFHRSRRTVSYEILRKLQYEVFHKKSHKNIEIVAHPAVVEVLKNEEFEAIVDMENRSGRSIVIRSQTSFHQEHYQINLTGFALSAPPEPTPTEAEEEVEGDEQEVEEDEQE
ncbi:MAG: Rne/Rng family ribonuclease [Pseudomonadota bacterium]